MDPTDRSHPIVPIDYCFQIKIVIYPLDVWEISLCNMRERWRMRMFALAGGLAVGCVFQKRTEIELNITREKWLMSMFALAVGLALGCVFQKWICAKYCLEIKIIICPFDVSIFYYVTGERWLMSMFVLAVGLAVGCVFQKWIYAKCGAIRKSRPERKILAAEAKAEKAAKNAAKKAEKTAQKAEKAIKSLGEKMQEKKASLSAPAKSEADDTVKGELAFVSESGSLGVDAKVESLKSWALYWIESAIDSVKKS